MAYRPVIIVHGILDGPRQFEMLEKFINQVRYSHIQLSDAISFTVYLEYTFIQTP